MAGSKKSRGDRPKMKTRRGAAKRFSRTGTGKVKFSRKGKRHILSNKSRGCAATTGGGADPAPAGPALGLADHGAAEGQAQEPEEEAAGGARLGAGIRGEDALPIALKLRRVSHLTFPPFPDCTSFDHLHKYKN